MLEYIRGKIVELTPTYVVMEANDVGYFIHISLQTYTLLEGKEQAIIYLYEAIREDAHTLYGFIEKAERQLFLLLISVSGIGSNTARMILSSFTVAELEHIILTDNVNQLKSVKGIGLKTAQRVIIDLKDKVHKHPESSALFVQKSRSDEKREEALAALMMLGFGATVSSKVVEKIVAESPELTLEKIIKESLKRI